MRLASRLAFVALWFVLAGCAGSSSGSDAGSSDAGGVGDVVGDSAEDVVEAGTLVVVGPDGQTPASFRVIAAGADGDAWAATCPGDPACQENGVDLPGGTETVSVKARGYEFALAVALPGGVGGDAPAIELVPLPAPEQTVDYMTGAAPGDAAAFWELAHRVDTELGPSETVKW